MTPARTTTGLVPSGLRHGALAAVDRLSSDLRIDGTVTQGRGSVPADLQGPEFAIHDPIIPEMRSRRPPRDPQRVLITLGGGLGWCGSHLVDGKGASRVARHLLALVAARAPEHRHVV